MSFSKSSVVVTSMLVGIFSCKSDSKSSEESTSPTKPSAQNPSTAKPEAGKTPAANPKEEKIDPAAMETDPNATDTVVAIDLKGKAPDDAPVHGKLQAAVSWTDKNGLNALVVGGSIQEKEEGSSVLMVADLLLWEGDSWSSKRQFKGSVDTCQFDLEVGADVGEWSVTDLDKNGIGEATFAWTLGCRSDVSPVKHKVFIVGLGDSTEVDKFVLRGTTALKMGGAIENENGYTADKAFDEAPKEFLAHAKKVWTETALETMN